MYPVTVSIHKNLLKAAGDLDPAGLIDILWAHALPEDGLEHIAQRVDDDRVAIMLFVKSDELGNACIAAIRIFRSALRAARPLADWKLILDDRTNGFMSIS